MNPLAIIAGKLLLKKVSNEIADRIHADKNIETIKLGESVYLKEADKRKAWVAVVITILTLGISTGLIPPEVGQALIDLISNEAVQGSIEGAVEGVIE